MNDYKYSNNGIDYDPDLIYENQSARQQRADYRNDRRQPIDDDYIRPRRRQASSDEYAPMPRQRRQPRQDDRYDDEMPRQQRMQRNRAEGYNTPPRTRAQQPETSSERNASERRTRMPVTPESQKSRQHMKPPKEPRERKPFREWGIVKFFRDSRFHAVIGVALVFLAGYITVAAISFIRSGAEDQSLISSQTIEQIVANGREVGNAAGPVGAKLAQSMLVQGLGLGSLALIVYLVLLGISLMGIKKRSFWSLSFKTLLVAITASMILGFLSLNLGSEHLLGGYHGHIINIWLVSHIDWTGAALVSLLLAVSVFYVYINDLLSIYNRWKAMRRARKARAEQAKLEQEEDREKVRRAMAEADLDDRDDENSESATNTNETELDELSVGFDDVPEDAADPYANTPDTQSVETDNSVENPSHDIDSALGFNDHSNPARIQLVEDFASESDTTDAGNEQKNDRDVCTSKNTPPVSGENAAERETPVHQTNAPVLEVISKTIEKGQSEDSKIYDPTAELSRYQRPGLDLLRNVPVKSNSVDLEEQEENKERITKTLNDYGIAISHIQATVGPTVTLYEIIPAEGVRIAKIKRLEDDIAMSLAALGIRIIAPIPGKGTIGIEVPNKEPQTVSIRSILGSRKYQECKYQLPMAMGATITNDVYIADLCKMPHLLVAGATGMGKSVGLNTIIASLLYKKHPAELKFVLIDPKMVEFSLYSVLERHFLAKLPDEEEAVVTSMDKVLATLNSLCVEMDQRYMLLRDANVRSISEYNERFVSKTLNPERGHRYLPYIVMIVDEFADLIMTAGKEVEKPIARIAQKARAVGMHMIIATQRPSTNVITGIIKANFPGRIAFRVQQMVDSKTILDRTGANQLIGRGDMLFSHNGSLERVQCAFIDTPEVQAICNHIDKQVGYEHAYYLPEPRLDTESSASGSGSLTDRDPLFEEIAEAVVTSGVASTSSLQRRYSIGFNRAGKIMDQLEAAGIVGPAQGGKPRNILVDQIQLGSILRTYE